MDAGGETCIKTIRRSYDLKEKWAAVQDIDAFVSSEWSRCSACCFVGISYLYYRRWKKVVTKAGGIQDEEELLPYKTTGLCCKVHKGRKSMLAEIKPELKAYILKLHEKGIQVTNRMVLREAARLLPTFKDKLQ